MDSYSIYPKQFNDLNHQLQSDTCFVIMPFSKDLDNTYMVIDSVASSMGINCTRADNISTTSEPILNKICTQISQAYYIIVDITNLNPNVFYELGIAHVLRDAKKVLIIKEDETDCPSDIKHLHYFPYSKSSLKQLNDTVKKFFTENNILEDLQGILDFLSLTPRDKVLSHNFVVSLSDCIGNNMNSLIMILNNKAEDTTQKNVNDLLITLTCELNKLSFSHNLYALYSELLLLLIQKTNSTFDISNYLSKIFNLKNYKLSNEWIADCGIAILDNSKYFDTVMTWILEYLKKTSPAEFDVAKYKIEIGIIKSKSEIIDSVLVNELKNSNKTLVEHCTKLIKERKTVVAIPVLVQLIEKDENPYVVRSSIDALINMAPLKILLQIKEIMTKRQLFVDQFDFINKHLKDLEQQIIFLQNTSNS